MKWWVDEVEIFEDVFVYQQGVFVYDSGGSVYVFKGVFPYQYPIVIARSYCYHIYLDLISWRGH